MSLELVSDAALALGKTELLEKLTDDGIDFTIMNEFQIALQNLIGFHFSTTKSPLNIPLSPTIALEVTTSTLRKNELFVAISPVFHLTSPGKIPRAISFEHLLIFLIEQNFLYSLLTQFKSIFAGKMNDWGQEQAITQYLHTIERVNTKLNPAPDEIFDLKQWLEGIKLSKPLELKGKFDLTFKNEEDLIRSDIPGKLYFPLLYFNFALDVSHEISRDLTLFKTYTNDPINNNKHFLFFMRGVLISLIIATEVRGNLKFTPLILNSGLISEKEYKKRLIAEEMEMLEVPTNINTTMDNMVKRLSFIAYNMSAYRLLEQTGKFQPYKFSPRFDKDSFRRTTSTLRNLAPFRDPIENKWYSKSLEEDGKSLAGCWLKCGVIGFTTYYLDTTRNILVKKYGIEAMDIYPAFENKRNLMLINSDVTLTASPISLEKTFAEFSVIKSIFSEIFELYPLHNYLFANNLYLFYLSFYLHLRDVANSGRPNILGNEIKDIGHLGNSQNFKDQNLLLYKGKETLPSDALEYYNKIKPYLNDLGLDLEISESNLSWDLIDTPSLKYSPFALYLMEKRFVFEHIDIMDKLFKYLIPLCLEYYMFHHIGFFIEFILARLDMRKELILAEFRDRIRKYNEEFFLYYPFTAYPDSTDPKWFYSRGYGLILYQAGKRLRFAKTNACRFVTSEIKAYRKYFKRIGLFEFDVAEYEYINYLDFGERTLKDVQRYFTESVMFDLLSISIGIWNSLGEAIDSPEMSKFMRELTGIAFTKDALEDFARNNL